MNFRRCTLTALATVTALWMAAPLALADDRSDIIAVLNHWSTNSSADCADDAAVIDSFPPFEWHGAGGCAKWQKDSDAEMKAQGMTNTAATIGKPRQLTITGDRAYAVAPITFAFTQQGKRISTKGMTTFTLVKTAAGWRITGWAYAALGTINKKRLQRSKLID